MVTRALAWRQRARSLHGRRSDEHIARSVAGQTPAVGWGDIHAFDCPYRGRAVEVLDATGPDITELDVVVADDYIPELKRSGAGGAQTLRLRSQPLPKAFTGRVTR